MGAPTERSSDTFCISPLLGSMVYHPLQVRSLLCCRPTSHSSEGKSEERQLSLSKSLRPIHPHPSQVDASAVIPEQNCCHSPGYSRSPTSSIRLPDSIREPQSNIQDSKKPPQHSQRLYCGPSHVSPKTAANVVSDQPLEARLGNRAQDSPCVIGSAK